MTRWDHSSRDLRPRTFGRWITLTWSMMSTLGPRRSLKCGTFWRVQPWSSSFSYVASAPAAGVAVHAVAESKLQTK